MSRERDRIDDEIGKKIKREKVDALLQAPTTTTGGGGGRHIQLGRPGILNTVTPCAACKLLRRRCAQECPFSPYFSPHEPHKFASVHKVFGASNVSKMLMEVAERQRADAANSLVYEANMRLRDPIYGCMGAISALQHQIQVLQAQVNAVRAEILKYKFKEANNLHHDFNHHHHHHHHDVANIMNNNSNIPGPASSSHDHLITYPSSEAAISVAVPPPEPPVTPTPPNPPLVSSSMYTTQPPSGSDFSSISNENISYFG